MRYHRSKYQPQTLPQPNLGYVRKAMPSFLPSFPQPTFNYSHRPTSTGRSTFATEPRPYHTLRELELYRITRSKEYEKWYNKPDRDRRSVQIKVTFIDHIFSYWPSFCQTFSNQFFVVVFSNSLLHLKRMAEEEYAKLKKQREAERREREMYEDEEWVEEVESRPRRYAPQPAAPAPAPKPGRLVEGC